MHTASARTFPPTACTHYYAPLPALSPWSPLSPPRVPGTLLCYPRLPAHLGWILRRSGWVDGAITPLASPSELEIQPAAEGDYVCAIPASCTEHIACPPSLRTSSHRWPSLNLPLNAILEMSPSHTGIMQPSRRVTSPLPVGGRRKTSIDDPSPPSLAWELKRGSPGPASAFSDLASRGLPAASSPTLSAVRRSIGQIEPQLQTMLRQTRISTALVAAMSAISLEAGAAWEARQRLKRLLKITAAEARWQLGDANNVGGSAYAVPATPSRQSTGTEKQRSMAAAQSSTLLQHMASFRDLFQSAPDGQPEEEAVLALLGNLKRVARPPPPQATTTATDGDAVRHAQGQGPGRQNQWWWPQ